MSDEYKQILQAELLNELFLPASSNPTQPQPSQRKSQYHQLMGSDEESPKIFDHRFIRQLKEKYQIEYDLEVFKPELECHIQYQTTNFEILKLKVAYGYFSLYLLLITVDENSPSINLTSISSGNFGSIYEAYANNSKIAIKSIEFKQDNFEQVLKASIRELFIMRIAFILRAGPNCPNIYKFDLVAYRNCIEFSMEFCPSRLQQINSLSLQLRNKLTLLHRLRIVHNDIKPENIAHSPYFNQSIFLDFGLSQNVKEDIGEKTLTGFQGSLQFCSQEMKQIYINSCEGHVDLYHNDAVSLSKSISSLQAQKRDMSQDGEERNFSHESFRFYECRRLILLKFVLLDISFKENNHELNYSEMKKIFDLNSDKRIEIQEPSKCCLTINYCKHIEKSEKEAYELSILTLSTKDQESNEHGKSQLFAKRAQSINQFNSFALKKCRQINWQTKQNNIYHPELCLYFLLLIKLIKINGETNDFDKKIEACTEFAKIMSLQSCQNEIKLYKSVIFYLLNWSLSDFSKNKTDVLLETIQTTLILQIISQARVIEVYRTIIQAKLPFFRAASLMFEFLISVQYTKAKLKSSYDYEKLTNIFYFELNSYLDSLCENKLELNQKLIFHRLKEIIQLRTDDANIVYRRVDCKMNTFHFDVACYSREQQFVHELYIFKVHIQLGHNHQRKSYDKFYNQILRFFKLRYKHSNHFLYAHFLLSDIAYHLMRKNEEFQYFNLFEKVFSRVQQFKHFRIYYQNYFSRLKAIKTEALLKATSKLKSQKQEVNFENQASPIFQFLEEVIQSYPLHFPYFLELVLSTDLLTDSLAYNNNLRKFFAKHESKLFRFSNKYHKYMLNHTNNQLYMELNCVFHVFTLLKPEDLEFFSGILQECKEVISQNQCLRCKHECLFTLKWIQAEYLTRLGRFAETLDILIDQLAFAIKYQNKLLLTVNLFKILRFGKISGNVLNMTKANQFVYETSMQQKCYGCYFIPYERHYPFLQIYTWIVGEETPAKLATFLTEIISQVRWVRSIRVTCYFFNAIFIMISNIDRPGRTEFKKYHDTMLPFILERQENLPSEMAIYFSALLTTKIKGQFDRKMMIIISKSIKKLDQFSKTIILSNYYLDFGFYFGVSQRKMKILRYNHLKKCIRRQFSLKYILQSKMKIKVKNKQQQSVKIASLRRLIKEYHEVIGNIQRKYT